MLWPAWTYFNTTILITVLTVSSVIVWWSRDQAQARVSLRAAAGAVLVAIFWLVAPDLAQHTLTSLYTYILNASTAGQLRALLIDHATMLVTGAAVVWLTRRAWQTLWTPVPELINILGVEVPDRPDVSLAGIKADAATLNWSRPSPNRPVQKFLIQVNGVVVGDVAANQEPAIVVSGLKPDHFYNVRVIAVGSNNFQAGSRVIRLRTFGSDGKPRTGTTRLPASFTAEEQHGSGSGDHGDDSGVSKSSLPALESDLASLQGVNLAGPPGSRRNTVTRRHSPSTASMDPPPIREASTGSETLAELTQTFANVRKEREDVLAQIAKEEEENKKALDELEVEKLEKRKEHKKKEEQTKKLNREVNSTDKAMRNAQNNKVKKEKELNQKIAERQKYEDKILDWERKMEDMKREMDRFETQRKELAHERDAKLETLHVESDQLRKENADLELELKRKREELKVLEDARKELPGGDDDDDEWRNNLAAFKQECQRRQRALQEMVIEENRMGRRLDEQFRVLSMQIAAIPGQTAQGSTTHPPGLDLYSQPNSSGIDFDSPMVTQLKRRSRNSNSLSNVSISSPLPPYSQIDPAISGQSGYNSTRVNPPPGLPGFAQGPFMSLGSDMPERLDEDGIRAISAPLSPSATALLPANILDDIDDEPSPATGYDATDPFGTRVGSPADGPQSPASSGPPLSVPSSPPVSTQELPFPQSAADDHTDASSGFLRSPSAQSGGVGSPTTQDPPPAKSFGSFFNFQRSRHAKGAETGGPTLGSLKHGQSQSFPRQDEVDANARSRRLSISGGWSMFGRNNAPHDIIEGHAMESKGFSARTLNPFHRSGTFNGFAERDPSSPRPGSVASTELPRPSTDSGSIWGPSLMDGINLSKANRIWAAEPGWSASRTPSRRPSLHGSPSALKTTLASADDEILDEEMPHNPAVGIIGRPKTSASKSFARLNPNVPAFMPSLFQRKTDKDGTKDKEKGKGKEKSKDKPKDKNKTTEASMTSPSENDSPADSRISRDTYSVHTQISVSESHESLPLDQSLSNTPSEPNSATLSSSLKDENVVRKLFRKGSSSKFSLPGRLGVKDGSSLFKKGPSSAAGASANSDTLGARSSMEDMTVFDDNSGLALGRSYESITSSPSLGPSLTNKSSRDSKSGTRWLSFSKKGRKEKESLDLDRDKLVESEAGDEA
ncbi:hypothetical protein DL546_001417 [Coniochaeta pulveracea]|uniref:Fibronectin type-III domain-containing protein n=1 Tax=Coniochaeta pulveracea TaxID=177199 RepID=A0A420Y740_9PEZI|nr:hypothetical protein DL546_001417 [Coniochaeta pulveracea]